MISLQQMALVFMSILIGSLLLTIIGMLTPEECKAPRVRHHADMVVVYKQGGARAYKVDKRGHRTPYGYTKRYSRWS